MVKVRMLSMIMLVRYLDKVYLLLAANFKLQLLNKQHVK